MFQEKRLYVLEVLNIPSNASYDCIKQYFSSLVPVKEVITEPNGKGNSVSCFLVVESIAHANLLIDICNNKLSHNGDFAQMTVRLTDKRNDLLLNYPTANSILWQLDHSEYLSDGRKVLYPSQPSNSYHCQQPCYVNERQVGSYTEGPLGANIFIYHLPQPLDDADLITLFAPFGRILSATVFIDRKTGESKGYGFVSFASPESACKAIHFMNGFRIDNKRLKVEHKKKKN